MAAFVGRCPWLLVALMTSLLVTFSHSQPLEVTVTTPIDDGYPAGSSWISLMATSLLGDGTPGYFWGAVPADFVETACNMIEQGTMSIPATVTAYGFTQSWNLQVSSRDHNIVRCMRYASAKRAGGLLSHHFFMLPACRFKPLEAATHPTIHQPVSKWFSRMTPGAPMPYVFSIILMYMPSKIHILSPLPISMSFMQVCCLPRVIDHMR